MNNNINLIGFMVNLVEGAFIAAPFLNENYYLGYKSSLIPFDSTQLKDFNYPLLLSKTIDSINKTDPWKIDVFYTDSVGWCWSYKDFSNTLFYKEADQAREAAIKYYMNMENKKDGKKKT